MATLEELLAGVNGSSNDAFIQNNAIDLNRFNTDSTSLDLGGLGTESGSWMDSLGGFDGLKGMMGIGQLGLGFLGYLDNKKTAKLQRNLLGQQIDTNQFLLNQAKGRQEDINKAFGGNTSSQGLAAATQAPAAKKVL